ncbi:hypothetical protein chiPu_0005382 [Chiloscyllium punctatum]|uniref:Uncharacterized protein n=1 Tax=Chiloscyllium punctatum TaxID=137246 RepID=A0A401S991_CHIPU|nr:hypothetical protein [Chiloscyllium punctatum]
MGEGGRKEQPAASALRLREGAEPEVAWELALQSEPKLRPVRTSSEEVKGVVNATHSDCLHSDQLQPPVSHRFVAVTW